MNNEKNTDLKASFHDKKKHENDVKTEWETSFSFCFSRCFFVIRAGIEPALLAELDFESVKTAIYQYISLHYDAKSDKT